MADSQHPDWNYRCNLWRAGLGPDPGPPPDPQHPAVPFEQAVDLLTGEPRQRSQHPDIAALAERLDNASVYDQPSGIEIELMHQAAAALRTLTRPVEDEEVRHHAEQWRKVGKEGAARYWQDRWRDEEIRATRAEQEAARLRERIAAVERVVHETGSIMHSRDARDPDCAVCRLLSAIERALAAAAGAEEPRSAVPGAPSPRWRQISPETEAGLKALDEATRLGPHRARKMPPTGEEEPR